ncbi:MAG: porin [Gammaproteobacteria bacterium]|nr:porin [Gammaproteobacteria bacterium]
MNKQLIVAAVGALVLPLSFVAKADGVTGGTEFTVYGRVVAGLDRQDSDKEGESAVWDFGATGRGGSGHQQSRLGFKGDRDLGNGMNAGFKMEQGLNSGSDAGFNTRHRYVYLSGGFGTLTIGQQSNPYLMGANWAQEWYLGGNTVGSFREEGIGYSMSNGPFSLSVLLTGDNGDSSVGNEPRVSATGTGNVRACVQGVCRTVSGAASGLTDIMSGDANDVTAAELAAANQRRLAAEESAYADLAALRTALNSALDDAHLTADEATEKNGQIDARNALARETADYRKAEEDIDRTIIGASYDFGVVKVGVGYNGDNTDSDYDWFAVGASGSHGAFGYYVGWQQKSDSRKKVAGTDIGESDQDGWGMFLSYDMSEADRVYMEYETLEDDFGDNNDVDYTILGYSHKFGGGVNFIGEYRTMSDSATNAPEPTRLALTMLVNF